MTEATLGLWFGVPVMSVVMEMKGSTVVVVVVVSESYG
jgi:hypothetical protein